MHMSPAATSHVLTALALFSISPVVPAQSTPPLPAPQEFGFAWPSHLGHTAGDTITEATSGYFSNLHRRDGVIVRDQDAVLFAEIGETTAAHDLGVVANDVAALPQGLMARDLLVVVGSAGLSLLDCKATNTCIDGEYCPVVTTIESNEWVGATDLCIADVNGDGYSDIAGLNAGGSKALLAFGGGPTGSWAFQSLNLFQSSNALALAQWTGSGDMEIAATGSLGLFVYSSSGQLVDLERLDTTANELVTLPGQRDLGEGVTTDGVAWLATELGGGAQSLVVVALDMLELPLTMPNSVSTITYRTVDAQSGLRDLYVTSSDELTLHHFSNQGSHPVGTSHASFSLGAGAYGLIEYEDTFTPTVPIVAEPLVADFDGDLKVDLVIGNQEVLGTGYVYFSDALHAVTHPPGGGNFGLVPDEDCMEYVYHSGNQEGTLRLSLDVPDLLPSGLLTTHIQVKTWRADDINDTADTDAVSNCIVSLSCPSAATGCSSPLNEADDHTRVDVVAYIAPHHWPSSPGNPGLFDDVYYIQWHPVHVNGSGAITEVGRGEVIRWATGQDAELNYPWMDLANWNPVQSQPGVTMTDESGNDGITTGDIIPGKRVPLPPPPPRPGTTCLELSGSAVTTHHTNCP